MFRDNEFGRRATNLTRARQAGEDESGMGPDGYYPLDRQATQSSEACKLRVEAPLSAVVARG